MTIRPEFLEALLAMAVASFLCRVGGYVLMRFVHVTPGVEAALRAIPLGVMIGIAAPSAASGRIPELVGLAAVIVTMRLARHDMVATLAGVGAVALLRALHV